MDELTNKELAEMARESTDKKVLREIADQVGVTYSGNSGTDSLKEKILAELDVSEETDVDEDVEDTDADEELGNDPISKALAAHREEPKEDIYVAETKGEKLAKQYTVEEMMEMNASKIKDNQLRKNVIRAQALRLIRVKINNLDPADTAVPGAIVTCYSKYTGKVTKYIPYDEDQHPNGYHVPQIILDDLRTRTFNLRKEIKTAGSSFGVKQYKTTRVKKFSIEELPQLTKAELKNLANKQQASGSIDHTV